MLYLLSLHIFAGFDKQELHRWSWELETNQEQEQGVKKNEMHQNQKSGEIAFCHCWEKADITKTLPFPDIPESEVCRQSYQH